MAELCVPRHSPIPVKRGVGGERSSWARFVALPVAAIILVGFGGGTALGIGPTATKAAGLTGTAPGALVKPHFTSSLSISVTAGEARTFTVTAAGKPTPTVFVPSGALPPGMVFSGGSGGNGTLTGTPTKLGETSFEIGAASAAGISLRIMNVRTRPSPGEPITSYRALEGEAFRITLPNPTVTAPSTGSIRCTGHFPPGVVFGRGPGGLTGTLAGDPQGAGLFSIACSARNSSTGTVKRWDLVLVVRTSRTPPSCLSINVGEVAGAPFALTVQVRGTPTPTVERSGAWPPGARLVDNGNGTESISGVVAQPGFDHLHLTESNTAGRCIEVFGLIVAPKRPAFKSPASVSVPVNTLLEFPVIASGIPTARISIVGACKGQACSRWPNFPSPLQIKNSNGVPVLVGSPEKPGTIRFALKAANSAGSTTQTFTLTVVTTSTTTSSTTTSTASTTSSTTTPTSSTTSNTPSSTTTPTSSSTTKCPTPAGIMALCRNANGLLSAFLVDADGLLERYDQAGPVAWGPEQPMSGDWPDKAPPVVVANQSGLLSAFLVGKNGALYRYDQVGPSSWGTAQSMAGSWPDTAPPVVVANQGGLLSAFLVGNNGQLYRYDQAASGAWGTARSAGGELAGYGGARYGGQPKWAAERLLSRQQRAAVPLRPGRLRRVGVAQVDGWRLAVNPTTGARASHRSWCRRFAPQTVPVRSTEGCWPRPVPVRRRPF